MHSTKRKLFIGCSKEALEVAYQVKSAIKQKVGATIIPQVWNETRWKNLAPALASLAENIDDFYYAIFIGFPDDELIERKKAYLATRDNTTFEFGLFLSRLGKDRTFFLRPRQTKPDFKLLTDLGTSLFVHPYDLKFNRKNGKWEFKRFDSNALVKHLREEEARFSQIGDDPRAAIASRVNKIKAEFQKPSGPHPDEYYINVLKTELDEIIYAKAAATKLGIKEIVTDTIEAIRDIDDFCKPRQLADLQSYKNGITRVWVFADKPLEFTNTGSPDLDVLRNRVRENLKNGVRYTYFVDPHEFKIADIEKLLPPRSPHRKNLEVIFVESKYFKTFFTLHFFKNGDIHSLYMSSILKQRNDLLIQITDDKHKARIEERLCILKGIPEVLANIQTYKYTLR